jgi:hypothetical protein
MFIPSKLEDFAQLAQTTRDELIRCALEVTCLPDFTIENGWLEEKLQVAHYAYGEDVLRNPQTEEVAVWLRRTLPLVVGLNRNASDAEFLKACGYSLEMYICYPNQHEIVLHPASDDVSAECHDRQERLHFDFGRKPVALTLESLRSLGVVFEHENYADALRHEIWHIDEETLAEYRMRT